jgi:superfamily II DNA or RNA helicase
LVKGQPVRFLSGHQARGRFLPFKEARAFARALGLKSQSEWLAYCRSGNRPDNIPSNPHRAYADEFAGWGDWLGYEPRTFLPFTEARAFARALGLKSNTEWHAYCCSGNRPDKIPSNAQTAYADEFEGWGDWLGTGNVAPKNRTFLPFTEAREFACRLGLKSVAEWYAYCRSGKRPDNIPTNPQRRIYRSKWAGWADWLGYETRTFLPFAEARAFARALGLKSNTEWLAYCCSGNRPDKIPSNAQTAYADEFEGWGDWLGTGNVANCRRTFLPFTEARQFSRDLGLKSQSEWRAYCCSGNRPDKIPSSPERTYRSKWAGWADWLGAWEDFKRTRVAIGAYLKSIASEIPSMRDASLVALIAEAGLDLPLRQLLGKVPMATVIADLRDGGKEIQERLREGGEIEVDPSWQPRIAEDEEFSHDELEVDSDNIHVADRLNGKVPHEFIEHLVQEKLSGLLVKYINGDLDVAAIMKQEGGEFYQEIRRRFESEIRGIIGVDTSSWKLRDKKTGKPTQPNLMQRYVAYKLQQNRKWCNWSGTGAGKTGSAGLASYVIDSRLTLVLCPNSTVRQWADELGMAFKKCRTVIDATKASRGQGSFLILNYEKLQSEKRSAALVQAIVGLNPDLVVLDEVQLIKRRERGGSSIRREALEGMLRQLPDACVLGMTATPVINELREGVSLLEAVTGKQQNLKTGHSVLNALNLHFALLQHGLRYKPEYQQSLSIKPEPFVENALVPALQDAAPTVLEIERTILPAKLEQVRDRIKPGTLIYLEFVEGMVPIVRKFVESLGLTVGEYIGDTPTKERESLMQKFIKGELEVLIGSRPVGLGVDGLQKRCNRLIVLSLPWTHAAFQQLYGRVYRQGSEFAEVEILIPQLVATLNGERWSWDEARYNVIEHKKTLSDTATDGYVPTSEPVSSDEFAKKAMDALKQLVKRAQKKAGSEIVGQSKEAPASSDQGRQACGADAKLPPKEPEQSVRLKRQATTAAR